MSLYSRRRALMSVVSSGPAPVHGTWEDLFARIADGFSVEANTKYEINVLDGWPFVGKKAVSASA